MQLIRTHDGLIGCKYETQVVWCESITHAVRCMTIHYIKRLRDNAPTERELEKDIAYALDHMAKTGDTVAEFGIFGSFMFSKPEVEYEF